LPIGLCAAAADTIIRTRVVAGLGDSGFSASSKPALETALSEPLGLALGPRDDVTGSNATLYVADANNSAVRAVTSPGTAWAVVQTPRTLHPSLNGSRMTAVSVTPGHPLFFSLLVVDSGLHWVYGVKGGSTLTSTVAGTPGTPGLAGEGVVDSSPLRTPVAALWVKETATYYIAEMGNRRIRAVTLAALTGHWVVDTVAGIPSGAQVGTPANCGGVSPLDTGIIPLALLYISDATRRWLVIADGLGNCIRALDLRATLPRLIQVAGGGVVSGLLPRGGGVYAWAYSMGSPTGLAYDAASDTLLATVSNDPNTMIAVLLRDNRVVRVLDQAQPYRCISGIAYDNDTRAVYLSNSCPGMNYIVGLDCGAPSPLPSPSQLPFSSQTASASASPSAAPPSASPTPSLVSATVTLGANFRSECAWLSRCFARWARTPTQQRPHSSLHHQSLPCVRLVSPLQMPLLAAASEILHRLPKV
jgi:hypothetical protein